MSYVTRHNSHATSLISPSAPYPLHPQEFTIGHDLDARLHALQELLGLDRSRALREAINVDKRNDYAKFSKLAGNFRQLKADNAAAEGSRLGEVGALQSKVMILEGEIQATGYCRVTRDV